MKFDLPLIAFAASVVFAQENDANIEARVPHRPYHRPFHYRPHHHFGPWNHHWNTTSYSTATGTAGPTATGSVGPTGTGYYPTASSGTGYVPSTSTANTTYHHPTGYYPTGASGTGYLPSTSTANITYHHATGYLPLPTAQNSFFTESIAKRVPSTTVEVKSAGVSVVGGGYGSPSDLPTDTTPKEGYVSPISLSPQEAASTNSVHGKKVANAAGKEAVIALGGLAGAAVAAVVML